jgi:LysM repeat protein
MIRAKFIAAILIASLAACLAGTAQAATTEAAGGQTHGRAYLFRGLIGLIDWGMDQLAQRISRSGVTANIDSHLMWSSMANQAINDYRRDPKPISVVGHSIGGDAAVEFAEALEAARVPVALLITYDSTRAAHSIPANVQRYINLYQSSNVLGGADLVPARGFHGAYASYNLKDRPEIIHVNLDKFERIQEQLAGKIRSAGAGGGGEPLRLDIPAGVPIELWDSGIAVSAHAGDTLQTIAATYHVPLWPLLQINKVSESAALTEGQHIVIPHNLGQKLPTTPAAGSAPGTSGAPGPENVPTATGAPPSGSAPATSGTPAPESAPTATSAPASDSTPAPSGTPSSAGAPAGK